MGSLYYVYGWGARGATVGQDLLGLVVEAEDGTRPPGLSRAFLRLLGYGLSACLFGIGFLMIAFSGRALHDPHRGHARRDDGRGLEPRSHGSPSHGWRPQPGHARAAHGRPAAGVAGVWELLHDLSVAVLFCFFLITFVAQAFRVQGTSMLPLLEDSERIIVNKFVYRFHPIERGDVVVFWYPKRPVRLLHQARGRRARRHRRAAAAARCYVNGPADDRELR